MSEEQLPAVRPQAGQSLMVSNEGIDLLGRLAKWFAKSSLVPKSFQGKEADCGIIIEMARRNGMDPLMLFQNCDVIHGRPALRAVACIAMLQNSGLIRGAIQYEFDGEGDGYGCRAVVIDAITNNMVCGPWITWQTVKAEGWDKKEGTKWRSMPDQMFRYRAASWLIRSTYPSVTMGMHTIDEMEDTYSPRSEVVAATVSPSSVDQLRARLEKASKPATPPPVPEPTKEARKKRKKRPEAQQEEAHKQQQSKLEAAQTPEAKPEPEAKSEPEVEPELSPEPEVDQEDSGDEEVLFF